MENLYQAAWVIIIYSFLGWCCEVLFAAMHRGKFVNRGFLNGPVCPIYGFGVALVLWALTPIKDSFILLFLGSTILTTALEFIVGYVLERFFKDKWWDYSENPFNIKGYVCLEFSLIWGLACVLVVDVVHPLIMKPINHIPHIVGIWILVILWALLIADIIITLLNMLKLPKRLKLLNDLEQELKSVSDSFGEKVLYDGFMWDKEYMEAFNDRHPELHEKIQSAYDEVVARRDEFNTALKEREDTRKEEKETRKDERRDEQEQARHEYELRMSEYEQRVNEIQAQIDTLVSKNIVHKRIVSAFPQLTQGKNSGEIFKDFSDRLENTRLAKKLAKKEKK